MIVSPAWTWASTMRVKLLGVGFGFMVGNEADGRVGVRVRVLENWYGNDDEVFIMVAC